jgi:hypothetical protein
MWGPAPQTQDMFVGVPGILATINVVVNGQDKLRYFAATTPPADQARHVQTVCGLATLALRRESRGRGSCVCRLHEHVKFWGLIRGPCLTTRLPPVLLNWDELYAVL